MAVLDVNRKQRLRTLENEIRSGMEEFYYTGMKLKEIRDNELYKEDGFKTWEDYCQKRWEWTARRVTQIITSAEYRQELPAVGNNVSDASDGWKERHVQELSRIPSKRDAAKVAAKVIKAIEQSRTEAEKNPDVKPLTLTASTVRKFVDADLGVNRAAKAKATRDRQDAGVEFHQHLIDLTGELESERNKLAEVTDDVWKLLKKNRPGTVKRLAAAVNSLAEFLGEVV
jgi:hypothetical protein